MSAIQKLRERFNLQIESPFLIEVGGDVREFQCLISGYGAKRGMVVDKDWGKIAPVSNDLVAISYGYSCFDIEAVVIEDFEVILDDWGVSNA